MGEAWLILLRVRLGVRLGVGVKARGLSFLQALGVVNAVFVCKEVGDGVRGYVFGNEGELTFQLAFIGFGFKGDYHSCDGARDALDCLQLARGLGEGHGDNVEFKAEQGGVSFWGRYHCRGKGKRGTCKGFTVGFLHVYTCSLC